MMMIKTPAETAALADRFSAWLARLKVLETGAGADIADIVAAAMHVNEDLESLLKLNPSDPHDAAAALTIITQMSTWLFFEIKYHVEELEKVWPEIERQILAHNPVEGA